MTGKRLVLHVPLVLLVSGLMMGGASAQTPARSVGGPGDNNARVEDLVKDALARYDAGLKAAAADAQAVAAQPAAPVDTVPLTLEEAVRHAMDNNLDMAVERLNPQTIDLTIAGLYSAYHPTATSRYGNQAQARLPNSLLNGGNNVNVDTLTYNAGLTQNVPWGGGNVSWNFNNARIESSDALATFNPQFQSNFNVSYTQPLLRNFRMDNTRQQIATTKISRDVADLNLKARTTNTLAAVRSAYWDYVYSIQAVEAAQQSLVLAQKLLSDNKVRVEVGTMAPMDIVQADAEAATRQQTLTLAQATQRTAELALKRLIVGGTNDPLWARHIDPIDRPDYQPQTINVEGAVRTALAERTDLLVTRHNLETNNILLRSFNDQKLPAVDLVATYGLQGLGGTQYTYTGGGVTSVKTGSIPGGYADALGTLFDRRYPNKVFQINVTYPIGGSQADASAARAKLLITQNQAQIRAAELQVATEVTNAALQVQNSIESLGAARAANELSQRRLDAEQSRFEVGMSTNYQVVQAQRDLRDAQNSELRALLNYRKSLVEFDRVQQAGAR